MDRPLTDQELDELDAFLDSETLSDDTMDLSTLDGFFAAIALNPEFILPSQWLPWVWDMDAGEESPVFDNMDQAGRINDLLLRHYNHVQEAIVEGGYQPLLFILPQEDDSEFYDAEGWSIGFMHGVTLFMETWQPLLDEHAEWFAPMMLLGTEEGWEKLQEIAPDEAGQRPAIQSAYEAIPDAIEEIYGHFLAQREANAQARVTATLRRTGEKVGRNDPCPCGSGKKFKKCCGAGPTIH